ncbi:MAG: hypothetical protein AVO33_06930 [delta proteobacterium ML8_F1]|nr:MAG: hypothetical protein AVO33_06930 [delta proteobacterium ML8_F1]
MGVMVTAGIALVIGLYFFKVVGGALGGLKRGTPQACRECSAQGCPFGAKESSGRPIDKSCNNR